MNENKFGFEYNGIKLKAVPVKEMCDGCYFSNNINNCISALFNGLRPLCVGVIGSVIFVEVEDE